MKLQLILHSVTLISFWTTSLSSKISDLKLCADKNCENVISYARTLAKHRQNDPIFLSFDRNEIVEITSKSAGSRPDLWGGKIGERKGYFPRSFVREYKVEVSNPQNVLTTQEIVEAKEPEKLEEKEEPKEEENPKKDDTDETELDSDDEEEDRWWENEEEEDDEGDGDKTQKEEKEEKTKDEKAELKDRKEETKEEKVESKEDTPESQKAEEPTTEIPTEKKADTTEVDETEILDDDDKADEDEDVKDVKIDKQDSVKTDNVVEMEMDKQGDTKTDKQDTLQTTKDYDSQAEKDEGEKKSDTDSTKSQEESDKGTVQSVTEESSKDVPPPGAETPKEDDTEIKLQQILKENTEENKDVKTEDEDDSDTEIQEENGDEIVEDETEIKEGNDVPENNTEEDTIIKEEAKKEKEETKPEEPDGNVKNKGEEQTLNEKEAGSTVIDGTTLNIQPSATLAEDKVTEEKKEKETLAGSSYVESFNTILPSSDQSVYSTPEQKIEKSDIMEGYTMIDGTPFPLDVLEDVSEALPEKTKPIESSAATTISPSKTDAVMQTEDALKHPPKEDIPADKVHVDSVKTDMNVQSGVNEFEQPSAESIEKSESENKTEIADEKVQSEDKSSESAGSPLDHINTLGQQEGLELARQEQKENVQEVASEGTTQPEMIEVSTDKKLDDKEKNVLEEYKSSVSEAVKAEDIGVKDEVKPVEDALKNKNEEVLSDALIKEELLLDKEVVQENNESVNTQEQQNAVQQDQPEVLVANDGRTDNVDNVETTTMSPVDSAVKPPTMDMEQSGVSDVKEKTDVDEQKEANVTPPDISPSSPSVSLQSSMDPQSYTGRQATEMPPQVTENQTEAEVKPNVDRTPDIVSDAYATRSFVSRQVLSHGAQQPPNVVGSDSETEASKKVDDAGSEGSKVVSDDSKTVSSDDSKTVSSDDSKTVNDDSKTVPDGSKTVPDDSRSIDDSTTVKPLEDSTVKPQDSTMSTPEDTTYSSKASTVTEVNNEPSVDQILTEPTGKPDVPSAAASQPWNLLPATVTKAIIQKLPPSLQSFLEQEPLGLSPQAIVLITIVTMTSLLLLTFISCLCQGRGKRKKDPVLVIREIEEKLFVVTKEKENLEDEVQDLQRKLQTVEDDFVTQQSTAESSQTDLQTYKLHNDVMKQTVQTQEADIKKLQGELKQKNKELKAMETQLKEKSAQIQKTESKLTEASGNLVKADEEKKERSDEITSLQKETERLKDIVEQLETSKSQLKEEVDVWSEKVKSMTDQLDYAKSEQKQMADDLALKENELEVLRDCFLQLKTFQNEEDNEDAEKIEEKLQSMMNVSRVSARLRSMEEESNNLQMRLDIEMQGRKDLEEKILDLERKSEQLTIEKMKADRQHQESLTKLEVLSTYFKQKELEMQRELGEQEALKKEKQSRLENADSRSKMIQEELDTYRSQVEDLKREIASAERDFRGQISSNEKKAHENWLAARAAERELKESRHETSVLRQKLTDLERRLMQGPPPNLIRPLPTRGIPPPGMLRSPPPFDRPGSRGGMPPHPSSSRDDDMSGPPERLMAPNDRRIPDHPEGHKPRLPPPPHDLRSPPPFDRRHMPPRSPPPYDRGMRFPIHPSERRSPAQRVPYPEGPPPPHPPPHLRGQPYPGQGPNTPRNDSLYNTGAHTPPYSSAAKNQESRQQSQV